MIIEGYDFPPDSDGEFAYGYYGPLDGGVLADPPIVAVCTVAIAFQKLHCLTGEGTGAHHSWQLEVDGQRSVIFHANTSYAPPVIQSLLDADGNLILSGHTSGNEPIVIEGRNFGPASRPRLDNIT